MMTEDHLKYLRDESRSRSLRYHRLDTRSIAGGAQTGMDLLLLDHTSNKPDLHPMAELLPLEDANCELLQNAERFAPFIKEGNIVAGICATDPFRLPEKFLQELKALGFLGVQNTPSLGLIDGSFRDHLERSRISYAQEVAMLGCARKMGLLALGTVFSPQNAHDMIAAGVDILVLHPGAKSLPHSSDTDFATLETAIRKSLGKASSSVIFLRLAERNLN